jgi:hypothetical protein
MDRVLQAAADRGIVVVLAMHSVGSGRPAGLWYSSTTSAQDFLQAWRTVLSRYAGRHWNLMGIDLLHRPGRGRAKWGNDDPSIDWNLAAQATALRLLREFAGTFCGLCFVQGIEGGQFAANFATDLRGVREYPLTLNDPELDRRLVYEVLVMGPSVHPSMGSVYTTGWPQNLYANYDDLFGFVEGATGRALVVGKWGGTFNDDQQGDAIWQEAVGDYLASRCIADTFYWAVNPNVSGGGCGNLGTGRGEFETLRRREAVLDAIVSPPNPADHHTQSTHTRTYTHTHTHIHTKQSADTGGLLRDDWQTPNTAKLQLLARVQPRPSTYVHESERGWDCSLGLARRPSFFLPCLSYPLYHTLKHTHTHRIIKVAEVKPGDGFLFTQGSAANAACNVA